MGEGRSTLEELLARAGALEDYAPYDFSRARRRIAQESAEGLWQRARRSTAPEPSWPVLGGRVRPAGRPGLGQAARDLRKMSALVVTGPLAAQRIRALVDDQMDPEGALLFACVLHLTDRLEAAQFWWQFAAGAGQQSAAFCLYLLHLSRGELRDAKHWYEETARLEVDAARDAEQAGLGDAVAHPELDVVLAPEQIELQWAAGLGRAVAALPWDEHEDVGRVLLPDAGLAGELAAR